MASVSAPARTLARERAMQFIFSLSFTNYDWEAVIEGFWETHTARPNVRQYGNYLIKGVWDHIDEIESTLIESLKGWTPERVGRVEWAILQIATFEMLFAADVPSKVAIDEAIELAKRYAPEEAPTFINGVLDRVMHGVGAAKAAE